MARHRRAEHRRTERGATVLLAALLIGVLLTSAAFVVDLGMQRVARADLQALADVVALDMVRELDGRTVAELEPVLEEVSRTSLARNAGVLGDDPPTLDHELGRSGTNGFVPLTSGVPSAVRVVARTAVSFAFASATGVESGAAARSAVAEASSTACFRLGSFVAAVRAEDSTVLAPLNSLLGANLDLVSYKALAAANLRLGQLAATSVFGSPEELLDADVVYADLLAAMIQVLSNEPGGNVVAVEALRRIRASAVTSTIGEISLGEVLHLAPTDRAAMGIELNVLDLVGTARLADGQHFLGVPNIQAQVPGVGFQFTGGLYLVSAAELACGMPNSPVAVADTAQLDGTVGIAFTSLPSLNIAGLGTLQTGKGTGALRVVAASGKGALVAPPAVHCSTGPTDPSTLGVSVTTGLASYHLTMGVSVEGEVKVADLLGVLGLGLLPLLNDLLGLVLPNKAALGVEVELDIGTDTTGDPSAIELSIPPNDTIPVSTGSDVRLDINAVVPRVLSVKLGGKTVSAAQATALKPITDLVIAALRTPGKGFIEKTLTPLVDNINERFIGPVARMVGLRLAGADVYGVGVTCGMPRLTG